MLSLSALCAAQYQQPLTYNHDPSPEARSDGDYQLKWPVEKIAVIGAGVG